MGFFLIQAGFFNFTRVRPRAVSTSTVIYSENRILSSADKE